MSWKSLLVGFSLVFGLSTAGLYAQEEAEVAEEEDPLAELAALGDALAEEGPEAGGSIRAKRSVDKGLLKARKDRRNFEAQVTEIKTRRFPVAAVKVTVRKAAKEGDAKGFKRGEVLWLLPKMKSSGKAFDYGDRDTRINAGVFYLRKRDKVNVRLERKIKGNVWEASFIERK